MTGQAIDSRESLSRLNDAARRLQREVRYMEVCGTHTVNAFRSGLHSLMPPNVTLLSGPGCPVCVTSQGDIDQLIELSLQSGVIMCTYGDMIRVTGQRGSLEEARALGADVRIVYSALDAVRLAAAEPRRQVIFAGVGFETTAPATAVAILEADRLALMNFTVFVSHKLIIPAMQALLKSEVNIDGFVCPGHVSVVIGSDAFRPIVEQYWLSCVITGFEGPQIAAALARLCELTLSGQAALENLYPQAVTSTGNQHAWKLIEQVFTPANVHWRGLSELPGSGLEIRGRYARFNARVRYELAAADNREPPGCRCGEVITGRCTPADCKLFGTVCTPIQPIGPCMVSSEGTCQAWFKYRPRNRAQSPTPIRSAV
ncbi:MAG TPA: hydrogenase formation protein HypD [Tepidisphaeraceae bacterium]|nr:hydrogenase formation protein HypD [Tepidisphaeraceae bacterium]